MIYLREGNGNPLQYAWKIPWPEEPVGCSSWGLKESDMTERLHFHFSLSSIGEWNGIPLQCSCLENYRDGRTWWAAVYGVAESTRLKWLSSSSSSSSGLSGCLISLRLNLLQKCFWMVLFPVPSQQGAVFDCLYFCDLNVDQWVDTVIQVCGRQDFQLEEFSLWEINPSSKYKVTV